MKDGKVAQAGLFNELLRQNIGFEVLVGAHSDALELILNAETSSKSLLAAEKNILEASSNDSDAEKTLNTSFQNIKKQESEHDICQDMADRGRLTQEEEREKGSISKDVYWSYLTAVRGGALVPIIVIAHIFFQVLQVASNYWMAWTSPSTTTESTVGLKFLFLVYILLSVGCSLCVLIRATLLVKTGLLTSQIFFQKMLHSIVRAPMSFFDSTPSGRILNRVST